MKKQIGLCLLLLLLLTSCSGTKTPDASGTAQGGDTQLPRMGQLSYSSIEKEMQQDQYALTGTTDRADEKQITEFESLSAMQLALSTGKIDYASLDLDTAEYLATLDPQYTVLPDRDSIKVAYSMALMPQQQALCDTLSTAISTLDIIGTLGDLRETYLFSFDPTQAPPRIDMPHYEGKPTIRVGVTGDVPPMDFVAPDGTPAGFNTALLKEIAELIQMNIELVPMSTDARLSALSSGKIDVIFWMNSANYTIGPTTDGTLTLTRSYVQARKAFVFTDFSEDEIRKIEQLDTPTPFEQAFPNQQTVAADVLSFNRSSDGVLGLTILSDMFARSLTDMKDGDLLLIHYGGRDVEVTLQTALLKQAEEKGISVGLRLGETEEGNERILTLPAHAFPKDADEVTLGVSYLKPDQVFSADSEQKLAPDADCLRFYLKAGRTVGGEVQEVSIPSGMSYGLMEISAQPLLTHRTWYGISPNGAVSELVMEKTTSEYADHLDLTEAITLVAKGHS